MEGTPRVLVTEPLHPEGLDLLRRETVVDISLNPSPEELVHLIPAYHALIVRSGTKVTREVIEAGRQLRVIARAGVGVDNVDIASATRQGILVVNTPEGSTVAAAEHTMALLLALARRIPAACASLAQGKWERECFVGTELYGKTLGIVGLGKIGGEVARRALVFGMRVLAYDPYISEDRAKRIGAELVGWEEILARSDFLTLHVPLTHQTRRLLNREALAKMKPGAYLINCARGGIVDEEVLLEFLDRGHLQGAALDVFEREPPSDSPLVGHPRVVATPHLGASTEEAQRAISLEVSRQVLAALRGLPVKGAVNAPALPEEAWQRLEPFLELSRQLGALAGNLVDGQIEGIELVYEGEISKEPSAPLASSFLAGFLQATSAEPMNLISAPILAKERGLEVREARRETSEDFTALIQARIVYRRREPHEENPRGGLLVLGGTVFGRKEPRITHVGEYRLDLSPAPHMLFIWNMDRPGMIGKVGSILGELQVNIAGMTVGRVMPGGVALMVLSTDSPVPPEAVMRIRSVEGIFGVRAVELGK
ncbi:MAG: phosphoglycerate dehydrogenase [Armatimonadota bacterium]|nr:phosphoglycerate dehydrogenase [Armatimonadota bacterium]MDR5702958.1 phosphoglycerate dehydrogenase [Armatimonadota bacterium]